MEESELSREELKEIVLKCLKIEEEQLKCAFIFGSRAYGTSKKTSDYDLLAVVEEGAGPLSPDPSFCGCPEKGYGQMTLEKVDEAKRVDINVFSLPAWLEAIRGHSVRALFCQTSLPPSCVLKMEDGPSFRPDFQHMILKHEVYRFTHGSNPPI